MSDNQSEIKEIWFTKPEISHLKERDANTSADHIGVEIIEAGPDYLKGRMPVDNRTVQRAGVLHGGMSVYLAETLASWAAAHTVDPERFHCVGQETNANHVRAGKPGWVYGIAKPLHLGRTTQVWDIKIYDESDKLICVSRMTAAVLAIPQQYKQA